MTITSYADADSDGWGDETDTTESCDTPSGYAPESGDCDDKDATVHPGADEVCDELDQDCDDLIDEGALSAFFTDADGDGFGDDDAPVEACEATEGTSATGGDCDDGNSDIHPDATEVCDGVDNDCDELIDDEDDSLDTSTSTTWYADADSDGFGDTDTTATSCEAPSDYVEVTGSSFHDCENDGVYLYVSEWSFEGTSFEDNQDNGLTLDASSALDDSGSGANFADNVVSGNGDYPLFLEPNSVGALDASSTYTGNDTDQIAVDGGTVSSSATWQLLDVDYMVLEDVAVQGTTVPELTVEAGVTMAFERNAGLTIGVGSYGSLDAVGTAAVPITFTTVEASPSAGDWDGLTIGYYTTDADTELDYVTIEYGGDNGYANLFLYYSSPTVSNSTLQYSSNYGAYLYSSSATLTNITYVDNDAGDTN